MAEVNTDSRSTNSNCLNCGLLTLSDERVVKLLTKEGVNSFCNIKSLFVQTAKVLTGKRAQEE